MPKRLSFAATLLLFLCTTVAAQNANDVNLLLSTMPPGRDPQRYKGYVEPPFTGGG